MHMRDEIFIFDIFVDIVKRLKKSLNPFLNIFVKLLKLNYILLTFAKLLTFTYF